MTATQKNKERKLRRALNKAGYALHKSRRQISLDNFGGYMIVDLYENYVVRGRRFELNLSDVEDFLTELSE